MSAITLVVSLLVFAFAYYAYRHEAGAYTRPLFSST